MNPIFNEYITFLNDTSKTKVNDLKEGYFWLDKSIIKGFDKSGNIHKFYRVQISDDLSIDILKPKTGYDDIGEVDLASWNDLIEINKQHLQHIESESLQLIKEKMHKFNGYTSIIPVSMGKDSMVVAHLVRSLYPNIKSIFYLSIRAKRILWFTFTEFAAMPMFAIFTPHNRHSINYWLCIYHSFNPRRPRLLH